MKTRLHKKQENCNKLLTFFTMGVAMLTGVVAMGLCTIKESYHQVKAYEYDDNSYIINLTYEEVSSNTFTHLADYLLELNNGNEYFAPVRNAYQYTTCEYATSASAEFSYNFSDMTKFQYRDPTVLINLYLSNLGSGKDKGVFEVSYLNNGQPYEYSYLKFTLNSNVYDDFKNAVELDIGANQPSDDDMPAVLTDFVSIIVSGIGAFATGVANGVSDFASALFLKVENGAVVGLSVFGGIVAIFAGLALAVAITTKVYLWITSLGN